MSDFAPEVGPDGRARPRYGEYASAEEQRSRIQVPDVTEALEAGIAPEPVTPTAPAAVSPAPQVVPAASVAPRAASPVNRLVTIMLLTFGAINVVFSVFSYLDIVPVVERAMQVMGIEGEFTNVAAAETWGVVAAIVLVAVYLLTAVITWRVLRAGRISWWIPLVGAIVGYVIVSVCLAVPLMSDPAFVDFVSTQP